MSATLRWASAHKLGLLIKLIEPVTWEEFHQSVLDSHQLVREVQHIVHLIIQVPPRMPEGQALLDFSGTIQQQPRNVGRIFIVPSEIQSNRIFSFAQRLSMIVNKVYPEASHVVFVQSLEQALALIGEDVETVGDYEPLTFP